MSTVLITGGAGFIGSHLSKLLLTKGFKVRILDSLSPQIHGNVPGKLDWLNEAGVEFIRGSVTVRDDVERALAGAAQAVWRATRLAPAAALAPPAPTSFGRLGAAAERMASKLDGKTRMVARRILRFPRRSATTVTGIALAMGLMVTTQHFPLAMNRIIEVTFELAQREDVMVSFSEAADDHILDEIRDLLALPAEEVFSVEVESGVMRPAPTPRLSALMANIRALA